ncbi:MAG TPA: chromosome segregation protein SMC, partial [Candidatus Limnocylindria bacterium]
GFKTFADATRFVFEPGVNAVIGPNGSGKSNMADAVRWVLGEQSNRSLRTRRADDVIFAGSQQRKPQGMAEAVLTLDNADGWLPIEFAEVSIGRRAYRSGESEYLINGARARLRDVVELLGEGRLGANELVVVGQGTVDSALSLRPEERRQLFEEAAGVKGLQVRKNEALARLGRARDNLTRISDLAAELRPQVRRLALQAQHQQEHDSLGRRARALVQESHRRREQAARSALGEARRRAAAAEAALEELRAQQAAGREAAAAAEERYWKAEEAARAAGEERESTREALIRAESRLESIAARVAELERARASAARELGEIQAAMAELSSGVVDEEVDPAREGSAAAEAAWRAASERLAAADGELVAAEEALAERRRREGDRIAAEARRDEVMARLAARRDELERELGAARAQLADAEADREPARRAAEAAAERATAARELEETTRRTVVDAQLRSDAARRRSSELAERVGAMRGELEALHERAEHGARLGSLLTAAGWASVLDSLQAPEEAWPAIEAAIGGELEQALVWRDGDLVERLAEARGAARLLAADGASSDDAEERAAALRAVAAERTLADWAGGRAAGLRLLRRTVVAPDLAALLAGWRSLPPGWQAVTPRGDVADGRGLISVRGRADSGGGESARRHARRRELAEALEAMERQQEEATTLAAREMAELAEASRRADEARHAADLAEAELRRAAAALQEIELRHARATSSESSLAGELAALPEHEEAVPEAGTTANAPEAGSLEELDARAAAARREREAAVEERDRAREAWLAAQAEVRGREERQVGQRRERATLELRQAQLEAERPRTDEALAALAADRDAAQAAVAQARAADEEATERRRGADEARQAARAELLELERSAGGELARLGELERDSQTAAIEASRAEEALAALARERELALESLPEPASAEPAATGSAPTTDPEAKARASEGVAELDDAELETELRRVRRTLGQIGSVNPFAVEEHRELATRLDELTTQETDLTGAIESTESLIATLDEQIATQFDVAFAAIGEKFDEFCRLLFAGGSASLSIGDGNDGETPGGIEIVVRPPGKRLQRLAMLSGGERALTGVALLFAMLSVNPVPFCILDEVDAALDEANIGRFADALRKLSESIDFVVITHNRATIEVADTIYGVTMTDAAVSRIVSLRLADLPVEATV